MPSSNEYQRLPRSRWRAALKSVIGILGISMLLTYASSNTSPCHNPPPPRINTIANGAKAQKAGRVTIASLNIASSKSVNDLRKALSAPQGFEPPDILLLQEVDFDRDISPTVAALADSLMMNLVYATEEETEAETAKALAILSRYPISHEVVLAVPWFNRVFNPRCRIALGVTVQTPIGAVRVFTAHLDNRINAEDKLEQVQTILDAAQQHQGPKIIAGDFNTADVLWLRHVLPIPFLEEQSSAVQRLMERYGYRDLFAKIDSTSDYLPLSGLFPLRLDWLFVNGMVEKSREVKEIDFSDHHLLLADLTAHTN